MGGWVQSGRWYVCRKICSRAGVKAGPTLMKELLTGSGRAGMISKSQC